MRGERDMVQRFHAIVFITVFALFGCGGNEEENGVSEGHTKSQVGAMATIVAVGDSLTAGYGLPEAKSYPYLLEQKLQRDGYRYKVINAGVTAETSSGTLSRIEWILTLNPDIVILETGANDGLRGISPELVENNIRKILRMLEREGVAVLLTGMKMVWNLGPRYVAQFNAIYPELADEFGVRLMPFFLEGVAMKAKLNLSDGIHPNEQGHKMIADNIYPYVLQVIQDRER